MDKGTCLSTTSHEEGQGPTIPPKQARREAEEPTGLVDQSYANVIGAEIPADESVNVYKRLRCSLTERFIYCCNAGNRIKFFQFFNISFLEQCYLSTSGSSS